MSLNWQSMVYTGQLVVDSHLTIIGQQPSSISVACRSSVDQIMANILMGKRWLQLSGSQYIGRLTTERWSSVSEISVAYQWIFIDSWSMVYICRLAHQSHVSRETTNISTDTSVDVSIEEPYKICDLIFLRLPVLCLSCDSWPYMASNKACCGWIKCVFAILI